MLPGSCLADLLTALPPQQPLICPLHCLPDGCPLACLPPVPTSLIRSPPPLFGPTLLIHLRIYLLPLALLLTFIHFPSCLSLSSPPSLPLTCSHLSTISFILPLSCSQSMYVYISLPFFLSLPPHSLPIYSQGCLAMLRCPLSLPFFSFPFIFLHVLRKESFQQVAVGHP